MHGCFSILAAAEPALAAPHRHIDFYTSALKILGFPGIWLSFYSSAAASLNYVGFLMNGGILVQIVAHHDECTALLDQQATS